MAQKHEILYVNYYTDGSAAKKIAPAFPAPKTRSRSGAKQQKRKVIFFDPVALGSLIVAAVLLVMMAVGLTNLQNAQAEADRMASYLEDVTAENQRLQEEFDTQVDLENVEKTALAMGMIPKEQVKTVDIQVEKIHIEEQTTVTIWDRMYAILTNLF